MSTPTPSSLLRAVGLLTLVGCGASAKVADSDRR